MSLQTIPLDAVTLSSTDAQKARRKRFDKTGLAGLAESVRTHGVLQPIVVRFASVGGKLYELVAGERG